MTYTHIPQRFNVGFCVQYLSSCFIVLDVHQRSGVLRGTPWVILLPLPGVHKLPGESVAVVHVVAAAAPQPVPGQVAGSGGTAAATGGELALAARAADGVDHAGRADGISEGCFPGTWRRRTGFQICLLSIAPFLKPPGC